ncbi:MAG TPA: hypothetical protein VGD29_16250 [Actinoplanes sp.]
MSTSLIHELGAVVAGLFVAAAVPASAASAAPVKPELQFAHVTLTPTDGKQQIVDFWAYEQSYTLHDVTAVIDTSKMPAGVTASLWFPDIDKNCKDAGSAITCKFDALPSDEGMALITFVNYQSTKAQVGAEGTASVKVTSRELGTITRSTKVTVAQGVDLAVDDTLQDIKVKPGATVAVPLGVRNNGEDPITGVDVFFYIDPWYGMAKHYSNCVYGTTAGYCHFDTELKGHTAYTLSEDMGVKLRADIPAPSTVGQTFDWLTPNDNSDNIDLVNGQKPKRGTDGALSLEVKPAALAKSAPQTDVTLGVDWQDALFEVGGVQNGDVAAVGAEVKGGTGDTVTAKVGVKNLGPAFEFGFPKPAGQVTVTAPAGTTVVSVPDGCVKAGAAYVCTTTVSPLNVNASVTWPFKLRIDKAGTLTGSVLAKSFQPDVTRDNDTAKLVVNLPAGAHASGGQGGGGLPITGTPAALIGGTGVLLLGGGAAAYVISRRKRARFVA